LEVGEGTVAEVEAAGSGGQAGDGGGVWRREDAAQCGVVDDGRGAIAGDGDNTGTAAGGAEARGGGGGVIFGAIGEYDTGAAGGNVEVAASEGEGASERGVARAYADVAATVHGELLGAAGGEGEGAVRGGKNAGDAGAVETEAGGGGVAGATFCRAPAARFTPPLAVTRPVKWPVPETSRP